ncbi:uncharacterized protein LOC119067893 [Bradysia coprophila]|uniref:uncharacterized protein LOC119067893 n=1 Tax=Bradysia coprophila TaxID=38358 RepID=UPI00187DD1A4|nr:uncharacterized protein LOC119067893 [Bradysia coprophila]
MVDDECYVARLNELLRQNSIIIQNDYSFTRKYQKCQTEIENAKLVLRTQKSEWNNFTFKLKASSNSIDMLSQKINETDLQIDRVKGDISMLSEKIGRISNDIMTKSCSLSNDDESKLIQRQMGLVLLNTIKYSNEIQAMQIGFDGPPNHTQVKDIYDKQWSQFRTE